MAEPQTGWASTAPGRTKHHFYVAGACLCSYEHRQDALQFAQGEVEDFARCTACNHPRHLARRNIALGKTRPPAPDKICQGVTIEVVRGRGMMGLCGIVDCAHREFAGFWYVRFYDKAGALGLAVLLAEGQLRRKEPPA